MTKPYLKEVLTDGLDDGTMPQSLEDLEKAVVGHRIVRAEKTQVKDEYYDYHYDALAITLDNGKQVLMKERGNCCAYTGVQQFLRNVESVDHVITGVGTTDGFEKWHIYADMGDMLELDVSWSGGNVGFYAYGFSIEVRDVPEDYEPLQEQKALPEAAPVESTEIVQKNIIDIDADIFSKADGSYFLSNQIIEDTPMEQFALFAQAMADLQLRAGVSFSADETSTGIVIAWKTRAA